MAAISPAVHATAVCRLNGMDATEFSPVPVATHGGSASATPGTPSAGDSPSTSCVMGCLLALQHVLEG